MRKWTYILAFALVAIGYTSTASLCLASVPSDSMDTCCCKAEVPEADSCCAGEEAAPETKAECSCHFEESSPVADNTERAIAPPRTDISKFCLEISSGTFQTLCDVDKPSGLSDLHASGPPGPIKPIYILTCSLLN